VGRHGPTRKEEFIEMNDVRYPIGRLTSVGRPLTSEERSKLVDTIEGHPERMRAAVAGLSDEQLDTPYRDDGWTARQVVHHVVDSHVNAYVRFKLVCGQRARRDRACNRI
jgi:hypothetical protein